MAHVSILALFQKQLRWSLVVRLHGTMFGIKSSFFYWFRTIFQDKTGFDSHNFQQQDLIWVVEMHKYLLLTSEVN